MCGIAGMHRRTARLIPQVNRLADELLLAIEGRGRHATGYLSLMENGKVQLQKETGPASRFIRTRGAIRDDARTVLLHTRYATTGGRGPLNAHPHASGRVAAVHNGTVYNADEIFEAFDLPRNATVDSEVIPALIDYAGWDQAEAAMELLDGSAALAAIHIEHPKEVILARVKGYPLVYGVTRDVVVWASTENAIQRAWHRTFDRKFPGKITVLAEREIVRVNGKLTLAKLSALPLTAHPVKVKGRKAIIGVGSKRARRRHKRAALRPWPVPAKPVDFDYGWYDEDEIDQLMADGMTRDGAETALYSRQRSTAGMSPATLAWQLLED